MADDPVETPITTGIALIGDWRQNLASIDTGLAEAGDVFRTRPVSALPDQSPGPGEILKHRGHSIITRILFFLPFALKEKDQIKPAFHMADWSQNT